MGKYNFDKNHFSIVKILKDIIHEEMKFKKKSLGYALLQDEHKREKKFPVWLNNAHYPIFLNEKDFEVIEESKTITKIKTTKSKRRNKNKNE